MQVNSESILAPEDYKEILKNYLKSSDFKLVEYEIGPFKKNSKEGFLADYLLIVIKYVFEESYKEVSFFAKQFPLKNKFATEFATHGNAYPNEIFTYEVLFNKFDKFPGFDLNIAPLYYYGKNNEILVFENLAEKGFIIPPKSNECSLEEIKLALEALAKQHAGSIWYQELKSREFGRKYSLLEDYAENLKESFFENDPECMGYKFCETRLDVLHAIIDAAPYTEDVKEKFKNYILNSRKNFFEILKPHSKFYNVMNHGDMWGRNVMYRYVDNKPVECRLIDYQLPRYCPPAHDVLQFIYLTTNIEVRKNNIHNLFNYYYDSLKNNLMKGDLDIEKIIPFEDFEASINYLLPQVKLQTVFFKTFHGAKPTFYERLIENDENYTNFCYGNARPHTLELLETDEYYKKIVFDALEDLKLSLFYPRITIEDCFKAVQNKLKTFDYEFVDYSYHPLKDIGGYLGDHFKVTINIIKEGKEETLRLFAKCAPLSETRYNLALSSCAFVKEAFVLRVLHPLFQENHIEEINQCVVPHHLLRVNDIILFEDIEFKKYFSKNPRACLNYDELKIVIKKLAIFHASCIVLEEKLSKNSNPYRIGERFKSNFIEAFYQVDGKASSLSTEVASRTVPCQIEYFSDINTEISTELFKEKVEKVKEVTYERVKPSDRFRNVVCHGDLWCGNIMMKYENEIPIDCFVIDYQILRYCPPAHDLLGLLYLTTNRQVRAQYKALLIYHYYKQFSDMLSNHNVDVEQIYPYQEFMKSVEYVEAQAIYQAILCHQITLSHSDLMKEYTTNEEASNKIFMEDRDEFFVDMCNRDPVYKKRSRENIEDLLDVCLKYY